MLTPLTYNNSHIHFGPLPDSPFERILNEDFQDCKKVIITDERVYDLWIEDLITNYQALTKAEIIQIPEGELFKNIEVCTQIWEALSEYEIGRNDLIINFGGGVITDLGGFVASVFKRGMKFINIPTTLLSQVDASIGGKTGIDLGPYKNQIGVFADAAYVFVDERYLETLNETQLYSGYAEMLKHGLIADEEHWSTLQSFDPTAENRLEFIYDSVFIKKSIVERDHKEANLRKILNFGHTVGHAIEGFYLNSEQPVAHGYAVVWGMIAEGFVAVQKDLLSVAEFAEIKSSLLRHFELPQLDEVELKKLIRLMYNDKKNVSGALRLSLIKSIGNCVYDQEVSDKMLLEGLRQLMHP